MDQLQEENYVKEIFPINLAVLLKPFYGDGMGECAASWTEDLLDGSSIPDVARGYLIFPAQKDEYDQEQLHSPGVER